LFDEWFQESIDNDELNELDQSALVTVQKLHQIIKPFMLRRVKSEVDKEIPPKNEIHLKVGLTKL